MRPESGCSSSLAEETDGILGVEIVSRRFDHYRWGQKPASLPLKAALDISR